MTAWLDDGDVRIHHGDALEQLALMPTESVHCIVTSPPFWGLRDYGTGSWEGGDEDCDHIKGMTRGDAGRPQTMVPRGKGGAMIPSGTSEPVPTPMLYGATCGKCGARRVDQQIGLEETPDEWCARLVAVMREARRVLRSDGVCWIEVGDTYSSAPAGNKGTDGQFSSSGLNGASGAKYKATLQASAGSRGSTLAPGIKPKDLVGAPWLLAFALRADGWYLRSDTIWARPNPMPESVTDRPTKAHSYVFLLTKSARYFYDADAIREPHTGHRVNPEPGDELRKVTPGNKLEVPMTNHFDGHLWGLNPAGRNARSVWSIATEPTPFAHFATFPQALVERCIKAGTSEHGACSECGAPWRRNIQRTDERVGTSRGGNYGGIAKTDGTKVMQGGYEAGMRYATIDHGWEQACECRVLRLNLTTKIPHCVPCRVLDPFMGSGTTALVARRLGRHAVGIELNAEYLNIAAKRLQQLSLLA